MIRWKREPREKGLARVCQGTRGYQLWDGDKRVGNVAIATQKLADRYADGPWYWYCAGTNSHATPVPTADEAKKQAMAHYKATKEGSTQAHDRG